MIVRWNGIVNGDAAEGTNGVNNKTSKAMEVVQNRIYFYSEIDRDKILELNRTMRDIDNLNVIQKENTGLKELAPIYLHVNSHGGGVSHGLSAMDNIESTRSEVITIVDGMVASAATFLTLAGNVRYITKNSSMLIHQLSAVFWGTYEEFSDNKKNLDVLMKQIKNIYLEKTKIPEKKLNEMLKHDLYFNAKTCLKYGLVDEII